MPKAYLTFDLGTTRLKVAAFDERGACLAQAAARHDEFREGTRTWQCAENWWRDCLALAPRVLRTADLRPEDILAVGVAGRGGAGVFLDANGRTLAEPWSDDRHVDAMRERLSERGMSRYAAALLAKLDWLRADDPAAASRIRYALFAKDYLVYQFTGLAATDHASGPDIQGWTPNSPVNLLPEARLPWEVAGDLSHFAAAALGLRGGTPVAVGAHDGIAANIGAGATLPHQYALTLGTHAVVRTVVRQPSADSRRFYAFGSDRHVIGGNALAAGRSLDWFVDTLGDGGGVETLQRLSREANAVPPGARGAGCLPFLAGEAAPERQPQARATFTGLSAHTTRAELFRATLEGTAFAIADIVDEVVGWCGEPERIGLTGSGVQLTPWVRILSAVLRRPLETTDAASEGRGIAMCCAVAIGAMPDIDTAARSMLPPTTTVHLPELETVYRGLRANWMDLKHRVGSGTLG